MKLLRRKPVLSLSKGALSRTEIKSVCLLQSHCFGGLTSGNTITFTATGPVNPVINMLHEIGHLVDNIWNDYFTTTGLSLKKMSKSEIHQVHCGDDNYSDNPRSHR